VKVIGGSEIYNFPIHHFVHLYSSFWRFLRLNSGTMNFFRDGDATPRRAYLDVRAHPAASRGPHLPEVPRPEAGGTPRRLEVARATRRAPVRAQGVSHMRPHRPPPQPRRPLDLPNTSPRSQRSSKPCALPRASLSLAGRPAAAGTAAARRRGPSPALFPHIPSHQIRSRRAGGRSPSFPRPRAVADSPESGHPRRRPTPGTQLRIPESSQGLPCKARTYL
jgi:hypothetical protein